MSEAGAESGVDQIRVSRLGRAALLLSVVAAALSAVLSYELLAVSREWESLLQKLPGDGGILLVAAWFVLCFAAIILGFVQLVRPRQRPGPAFAALATGGASLLIVSVFAVGAFFGGSFFGWGSHQSDEAMIASFKEYRAEYEQLLHLFEEHRGLESIADTGVAPNLKKAGLSRAQSEQYRGLMKDLGVESVERYFGTVLFITSTEGLAVSGSMKGYVYAKKPPSPIVQDSERRDGEPVGEAYRHIEDDWYIIYEWDT